MADDNNSGNMMLEMMGMSDMFKPNPYTSYPGAMPMPGYSDEIPTDSSGASLSGPYNSYLAAHSAPPPAATPGTTLPYNPMSVNQRMQAMNSFQAPLMPAGGYGGAGSTFGANANWDAGPESMAMLYDRTNQGGSPAAPAAPAPPQPTSHDQAYLYALAHPPTPAMPGATVPQSTPIGQGQPSVMQAFLASHPGGTGAGNYDNRPVIAALNKAGKGGTA